MKREYFDSPLKCPNCKAEGRAHWSENENPVYARGLDRELEGISGKFEP